DDTLRTHSNLALLYSLMDRPDAGFRHSLHMFEYRPTAPNVLNGMASLIDRVSFETFTAGDPPAIWKATVDHPPAGWIELDFDHSRWREAPEPGPGEAWIRCEFHLVALPHGRVLLRTPPRGEFE